MLEELREKYDVEAATTCNNLPLEFERIYLDALNRNRISKTYELKSDVVHFLPRVKELSLHQEFLMLPINDILTTNYDYYIEKAIENVSTK